MATEFKPLFQQRAGDLDASYTSSWCAYSGWLLIASGIFHVFVMLWYGGQWEGSISWRKPILFGISTGLTMASLGWVLGLLQPTRYDPWMVPLVAVALIVEVSLITLQQWRGVASHFNESTVLNAAIDRGITVLIIFAAIVIFDLTRRCFGVLDCPVDIRLAARSGMVFLSISCLIGFGILSYGQFLQAVGNNPELHGKAGVLKFPHGIAIHAIQGLPILNWMLARAGLPVWQRCHALRWAAASVATFLCFSVIQTVGGRARFDLSLSGGLVLLLAIMLLLPIGIDVVRNRRQMNR